MSILIFFSFLLLPLCHAAYFDIVNQCPHTIWPAAIPGGGRRLLSGQNWTIFVNPRMDDARIWARTGCTFNDSGHGRCETGDCNGLLECQTYGSPPNTLAEFTLNGFNNLDFIDISLVEGFNVPIEFSPTAGCSHAIQCSTNITEQCPDELKTSGGCNDPCTVFKTDEYCCKSGNCRSTSYSKFFKGLCPNAYSYPMDDETSSFTCIGGTDYKVVFCPNNSSTNPPPTSSGYSTFNIVNNCSYSVWAAAIPAGGKKLDSGQSWTLKFKVGTTGGRVWARTGCNFSDSGNGSCETGDCNGLLQCKAYGKPPNTLAEFALNQINNLDFMDISLVDGFNVPMSFTAEDGCQTAIECADDMNSECPTQLKVPGGCNNPCTVFKTDEYCCSSGSSCRPNNYTRFFKGFCPAAYSFPKDDKLSTYTCPGGTNFKVLFCPTASY